MFCGKCAHVNADGAVFCNKCGSALEKEDETIVARRKSELTKDDSKRHLAETEIFSITPTLKFVYVGYILAAIGAFFISALFSVLLPGFSIWIGVLIGMSLFFIPAIFHLRKKLSRYTLTTSKIEIDTGLIARTTQNIPIRRVQDITVKASIPQRLMGLGDMVVDNAGSDGGRIILKNIDSPKKYAKLLMDQMSGSDQNNF